MSDTPSTTAAAIPVICDRCRAAGTCGEADFSHLGDLLDFEPVPRRPRVNGWSPDAQRAFIALLSATGSKRRAATSIGRNAYGVDQLLKARNSDSFKAAYDRAMAIAKANGSMKLAQGVADAAARNAQLTPPSRLRGLEPDAQAEDGDGWPDERKLELLESIFVKYLRKVEAEREARLAGRIIEADFTLRQITCLEVMIDLMSESLGRDGFAMLRELHPGDYRAIEIAETPFSRLLDQARRDLWADMGEPERPEHPDQRYLVDLGEFSVTESEAIWGGPEEEIERQKRAFEERHRRDAEKQIQWEARARADFEARASRSSLSQSDGGEERRVSGGQPSTGGQSLGDRPEPEDGGGVEGDQP